MKPYIRYPGAKWLLAGWHRITMPALAEHGKQAQEVLWLNPQASTNRQLSFDFEIA